MDGKREMENDNIVSCELMKRPKSETEYKEAGTKIEMEISEDSTEPWVSAAAAGLKIYNGLKIKYRLKKWSQKGRECKGKKQKGKYILRENFKQKAKDENEEWIKMMEGGEVQLC